MADIIAYYRVSTRQARPKRFGVGGPASRRRTIAKATGAVSWRPTGKWNRGSWPIGPNWHRALAHAKRSKATLVVAKLDRLARNVAFLSSLMLAGVDFIACDNPHANKLTVHILAAVAEDEAERIAPRTKAALQAAKARGVKLGSARPGHWEGKEELRADGLAKGRIKAAKVIGTRRRSLCRSCPDDEAMERTGITLQEIADELNAEGHTTRRGKPSRTVQVMRVLERAE